MNNELLKIGDKTWFKGDEVTITTEPYKMYGGMWLDAVTDSGKTVSIVTEDQQAINLDRNRSEYKIMQDGFKRLHNANHIGDANK